MYPLPKWGEVKTFRKKSVGKCQENFAFGGAIDGGNFPGRGKEFLWEKFHSLRIKNN